MTWHCKDIKKTKRTNEDNPRTYPGQAKDRKRTCIGPHRKKVQLYQNLIYWIIYCAKSYAGSLKLCSLSAGLRPQLSCAESSAIRVVHTRKRVDNWSGKKFKNNNKPVHVHILPGTDRLLVSQQLCNLRVNVNHNSKISRTVAHVDYQIVLKICNWSEWTTIAKI